MNGVRVKRFLASPSPSSFPTRREVVLLTTLLLILIFWPRGSHDENTIVVYREGDYEPYFDQDKADDEPVFLLQDAQSSWAAGNVPNTSIIQHEAGWTLFERLYVFNGTIFIVTDTPEVVPDTKYITSTGVEMKNTPEMKMRRLPTDQDIRVVTPAEAQSIFNTNVASRIPGTSFLSSDHPQFVNHYYHFCAEHLFGFWRTYTSLDPFIRDDGQTNLPPPRRFIFRHVKDTEWRDYAEMNQWVLRGAFPAIDMEFEQDWEEKARMRVPFVYDRVVLGDRAASYEGETYLVEWRMTASAFNMPGSIYWWQPLRKAVLEYSGIPPSIIKGPTGQQTERFVITYISRQDWGRRMLRQADHLKLVEELYKLHDLYGYEVNVVSMDKLSRLEQMELAARTTIMLGVHGNGLTHLLWMRPNAHSTVIEMMFPEGFATDYEFTTRALGMRHYGVWNNVTFTKPHTPQLPQYPEGFQGNDIPVDGAVVAKLIHERLTLGQD